MIPPKTINNIKTFIKRHSNNNIINIENINYQAYCDDPSYVEGFNSSRMIIVKHKLILDCRCKDNSYFEGYNELGKMVHIMFRNELIGIDGVVVRYNYSNYFCKD